MDMLIHSDWHLIRVVRKKVVLAQPSMEGTVSVTGGQQEG